VVIGIIPMVEQCWDGLAVLLSVVLKVGGTVSHF
jgi:hypothetical protein